VGDYKKFLYGIPTYARCKRTTYILKSDRIPRAFGVRYWVCMARFNDSIYNNVLEGELMALFINESGAIGLAIIASVTNITGSLFISLLLILMFGFALAFLFKIPTELTVPLFLPFLIVCMAYSGEFLAVGGVIILYLSVIFTKMFFMN